MITKMTQNLRKSMEAMIQKIQGMFNKDLEETKHKQMNSEITKMKNTLIEVNSRITEAGGWVNDLEGRTVEITVTEQS